MAVTWKKLAYEDDVILKTLADANSVLYAVSDNTPAALAMAASTVVARLAAGNVVAATPTEIRTLINVEDGADATDATNVAAAGAVMETDYSAKGAIVAGTGAGTAGVLTVGANDYALVAASGETTGLKWAAVGTGNFKSDGTVPMSGALDFDNHEATDLLIQDVANEAAVAAYADPQVAKVLFAASEKSLWICTVAA
jgi:hypothetical protein